MLVEALAFIYSAQNYKSSRKEYRKKSCRVRFYKLLYYFLTQKLSLRHLNLCNLDDFFGCLFAAIRTLSLKSLNFLKRRKKPDDHGRNFLDKKTFYDVFLEKCSNYYSCGHFTPGKTDRKRCTMTLFSRIASLEICHW